MSEYVRYSDLKIGDQVQIDSDVDGIAGGVYTVCEGTEDGELAVNTGTSLFDLSEQVDDPMDDTYSGVTKL